VSESLAITKMSGAGNDFVVIGPEEARRLGPDLVPWTRRVCRRGVSVGADGVLVVEPVGPDRVRVRFFNPDGVPAFCGNGSRCAARFASLRGFAGSHMLLETSMGPVPAELLDGGVRLVLPPPVDRGDLAVEIGPERLHGRSILAGVPHFILRIEALEAAPVARLGPSLRSHARFGPEGSNVDWIEWRADGRLGIRTWERGVEGETLACGSGAVAAAFFARLHGAGEAILLVPRSGIPVHVTLPGRPDAPESAILEGDARVVFEGSLGSEGTTGYPV